MSGVPTAYVVIALGDADEPATEEDLEAVRDAVRPFVALPIDDAAVVGTINRHLLERLSL
jgi:hypothetical protein